MVSPARLWRSSMRLRLTVAGTLLAAMIFAIGGSAAVLFYHRSLTDSVWGTVTRAAREVAAQIKLADQLPGSFPMPVSPGVPRVQVLDSGNHVISGDPASAVGPPMYRIPAGLASQRAVLSRPAFLAAGSAAVYAVRTATPHGPATVVAALSLDPVGARTREAAELTVAVSAAALTVVALVSWLIAGRALRPVVEMLDSLEASVRRQRRFVADAAHELRTPLAGLTTVLEVARSHPDHSRTSQRLLSDLLAGHRRLARLVNDLLILAAVDGRAPRRAAPVDLAGVVTDCSRRPVPDGVSLRLRHLDRVLVVGDESQLSRVVSNLVDNALRYASSLVELSVREDSRQVVVCVSDDGPGIPVADRERIWERFARLDDDRSRASGGSGLGLAMVKELTTAHGGTVSVASRQPEPGAVFLVCLPVMTG